MFNRTPSSSLRCSRYYLGHKLPTRGHISGENSPRLYLDHPHGSSLLVNLADAILARNAPYCMGFRTNLGTPRELFRGASLIRVSLLWKKWRDVLRVYNETSRIFIIR